MGGKIWPQPGFTKAGQQLLALMRLEPNWAQGRYRPGGSSFRTNVWLAHTVFPTAWAAAAVIHEVSSDD